MPRVNRAVELLSRGQPIYYGGAGELSYEKGRRSLGEMGGLPVRRNGARSSSTCPASEPL